MFASQDSRLYSLNAKTGKLIWKYAIEDQIQCSPTIVEGRAFLAGCDGKLHIVDVDKGEAMAAVDIMAPTGVTPAVHKDHVYVGTEGGQLFCINWRTAKTVWSYADPKSDDSIRSSAAVSDSAIVFGSRSRQIYMINPKTQKLEWQVPSRRGVDSSPVIAGTRAYVGVGDGKLLAINLKSGDIEWQYQARGGFGGSPAIADGHLVIASDEGIVYCFGAAQANANAKSPAASATVAKLPVQIK